MGIWWVQRGDPIWMTLGRVIWTIACSCTAIFGWLWMYNDFQSWDRMRDRRLIREDVERSLDQRGLTVTEAPAPRRDRKSRSNVPTDKWAYVPPGKLKRGEREKRLPAFETPVDDPIRPLTSAERLSEDALRRQIYATRGEEPRNRAIAPEHRKLPSRVVADGPLDYFDEATQTFVMRTALN